MFILTGHVLLSDYTFVRTYNCMDDRIQCDYIDLIEWSINYPISWFGSAFATYIFWSHRLHALSPPLHLGILREFLIRSSID